MALPENRKRVKTLVDLLSDRIVGQKSYAHGEAVEIIPAGNIFHGQEINPYQWRVRVKPTNAKSYCIVLDEFIGQAELHTIFKSYFNMAGAIETYFNHPYMLKVNLLDRVARHLPPSVAIGETMNELVMLIDWGSFQEPAVIISQMGIYAPSEAYGRGRYYRANDIYQMLINILKVHLNDENTYICGPSPEYPYEPRWRTDIKCVLGELTFQQYDYAEILDTRWMYMADTKVIVQTSIRFVKNR